jgi:putative membrane protein
LDSFNASEVILVTDGYTDEAVLPLVQSRVPVSSIRRIVIKHSESIEETAALFSRYLKLIWENPRYARVALGIPGLLLFLYAVLSIVGVSSTTYLVAIILILGSVLLIKGFGVDRGAKNLYKWTREYSPPPLPVQISNYAIIGGILCVAISVYLGVANASANAPVLDSTAAWISALPTLAGFFIKGVMDLLIVGIIIGLFGRSMRLYFERDVRLLRNVALIVSVGWFRWILNYTADILFEPGIGFNDPIFSNLVFAIVVGILIAIASVLVIFIVHRSAKDFFKESEDKAEEFENN